MLERIKNVCQVCQASDKKLLQTNTGKLSYQLCIRSSTVVSDENEITNTDTKMKNHKYFSTLYIYLVHV